jgi:hypothetical protein
MLYEKEPSFTAVRVLHNFNGRGRLLPLSSVTVKLTRTTAKRNPVNVSVTTSGRFAIRFVKTRNTGNETVEIVPSIVQFIASLSRMIIELFEKTIMAEVIPKAKSARYQGWAQLRLYSSGKKAIGSTPIIEVRIRHVRIPNFFHKLIKMGKAK